MQQIKYHPKALAEAFRSADWYDRRQAGLGNEFFDELDATIEKLQADPHLPKPDANGVRSRRLNRFPFRVHYALDPDRIRILAVAHAKRRTGYWRTRVEE